MSVLPWVTGLTLAGILPLLFTHVLNQQAENHDSTSITSMLKTPSGAAWREWLHYLRNRAGISAWPDATIPQSQGVSNASIGFWMAVLVSAGILGNGRLNVQGISLVDCWCCVSGLCRHSRQYYDALARRRWPQRYSSLVPAGFIAISGGDGLSLRES